MLFLILLLIIGWVAVITLGPQAYFRVKQSNVSGQCNRSSESFLKLMKVITGKGTDCARQRTMSQGDS